MDPSIEKKGGILDLLHATPLHPFHKITFNNKRSFKNSDYIIHCAGGTGKIKKDRNEVAKQNIRITREIFEKVSFQNPGVRIIVVTNPVDIISYHTRRATRLSSDQVIGTGTFLDSIRLSYYVSQQLKVTAAEVTALVLGEHGETMVPVYSQLRNSGKKVPLKNLNINLLNKFTRNAAFEIKKTQGATYYGVSAVVLRLLNLFLIPQNSIVMPCSMQINKDYQKLLGIKKNIYLGLPVEFYDTGQRFQVKSLELTKKEIANLKISAQKLQSLV